MARFTNRMILASTVGTMVAMCAQAQGIKPMTAEEIDTLIRREALVGSPWSKVIGFLDAKGIEHSEYLDKQRAIHAIIRNVSRGALVSGSVQIEFLFDAEQKLKEYNVREIFTGP